MLLLSRLYTIVSVLQNQTACKQLRPSMIALIDRLPAGYDFYRTLLSIFSRRLMK